MAGSAKRRYQAAMFKRAFGFSEPPPGTDLTGYNPILDNLANRRIDLVDGDVLEIGVLLGGGTYKLANWFATRAPEKRLFAVDVFDPDFDSTATEQGQAMASFYADWFHAHGVTDQRSAYDATIAGLRNVVTLVGDSAEIELPSDRLCFAFIDGNHANEYVRSDFEMAWSRLSPGGLIAVHDYGGNLPGVTHTINALIGEHADQVARFYACGIIAFVHRELS